MVGFLIKIFLIIKRFRTDYTQDFFISQIISLNWHTGSIVKTIAKIPVEKNER